MAPVHRQLAAAVRNGLLRPGPDRDYADGDDSTWMDVDWRGCARKLEIDGRRVNVIDTGGQPGQHVLVWIHGLSGLWQNWLLNIPAFMDRYRCVALDLPGFGESEMPREKISIGNYARTVEAMCEQLEIECPTVIGNSMGGFIGAELAITQPTRVDKLVLISAAGLSTEYRRSEPLLVVSRLAAIMSARIEAQNEMIVRRPRLRRMALQGVLRYPERLSAPLTWELVLGGWKEGFIPALKANLDYSYRDKLERIEIPTLIVWGRNDMIVPVDDADLYEELIGPNARKEIFENTGHMPMLERPSRFNEMLDRFLSGEPAPEREVEGVSA